ncbi:ABC transporter permease [Sorangium sp. So ce854]|uniref:ABC transporter permease n=1 Tax=Sorangium sp. So ce854 TaxID=3133322 RepID=UPI003F6323BE
MSVQTGSTSPAGPAPRRLVDRARRLVGDPNPIWIRELKQAARLARTPVILLALAVLMTLLIASIGGMASRDIAPAKTGVILFQVFFSVAYFVVALVGPAVAANSIASEREGRTWEAVLLTGIPPGEIARGKFLAAYTAISMYVVMLAPVGALPFLFGGITAMEVVIAFAFLFLIALLSVAFGLAISSTMASLRAAILVTLLLAFPLSMCLFMAGGAGLSLAAHRAWPEVPEGPPIWLPVAYQRAPFGLDYALFLIVLPIAAIAVPAWFLYEVTVANLTSESDDRSSGLKTWFAVCTPVIAAAAAVPAISVEPTDRLPAMMAGMCAMFAYLTFCVFLFAGEPIGPSRRVEAHWARSRAGRLRRFLGPGVARSAHLLLAAGVPAVVALWAIGHRLVLGVTIASPEVQTRQLEYFAVYALGFYVFLVGLGAFLRARTASPMIARVLLLALLFAVAVGPWIVAAIAGLVAELDTSDRALLVAAPSPFYAFAMISKATHGDPGPVVIVGYAAAAGWVAVGLGLLAAARARCTAVIAQRDAAFAQTSALLAQEDEASRAAEQAARARAAAQEDEASRAAEQAARARDATQEGGEPGSAAGTVA